MDEVADKIIIVGIENNVVRVGLDVEKDWTYYPKAYVRKEAVKVQKVFDIHV